jgi:hypothetical protein
MSFTMCSRRRNAEEHRLDEIAVEQNLAGERLLVLDGLGQDDPAIGDDGEHVGKVARGIRANSSRYSHAELDNAPELDIGDPYELGGQYADLRRRFPHMNVLGGCCGTDHRHVDCISAACRQAAQAA